MKVGGMEEEEEGYEEKGRRKKRKLQWPGLKRVEWRVWHWQQHPVKDSGKVGAILGIRDGGH